MAKKWLNEEALDVLVNYYYPRAKWLHDNCNWGKLSYTGPEADIAINDPLMQEIDIYDCYTRNAAGFSNVLQDLKYRSETPKRHHQIKNKALGKAHWDLVDSYISDKWDLKTWLYVYIAHRATGSGASFTRDHGYRNNAVHQWGMMESIDEMMDDLKHRKANSISTFTSIGNQPPTPRKGVSVIDYLTEELPSLLDRHIDWLHSGQKKTHKEVVDWLNEYNVQQGHKRFNFVYAAFSYDLGDYHKDLVDDMSHGYFGNNAVRCMKMLSGGYTTDEFMDLLCERMGGAPRDNEDVMCDFVRFGQNYVPRSDDTFDHVPSDIQNNSGWNSGWEQRQGKPKNNGVQLDQFMV
jgi:hypothetical protein